MLKLLKYELQSRKKQFVTFAILTVALELATIYLLYQDGLAPQFAWIIMALLPPCLFLLVFLDTIINYYKNFTQSHGTLLFLTPNNGYKILGAKLLNWFILFISSIILITICYFITWRFSVITNHSGVAAVLAIISEVKNEFSVIFDSYGHLIGFAAIMSILQFLTQITNAITSITLAKSCFSKSNYYWLFALLFYIGIGMLMQIANSIFIFGATIKFDTFNPSSSNFNPANIKLNFFFIYSMLVYLFFSVGGYILSSRLISKRVDL